MADLFAKLRALGIESSPIGRIVLYLLESCKNHYEKETKRIIAEQARKFRAYSEQQIEIFNKFMREKYACYVQLNEKYIKDTNDLKAQIVALNAQIVALNAQIAALNAQIAALNEKK